MYSLTVEHEFCAAHALRIAGAMEPTHGHNFRVSAEITGDELDHDGLLCDFHTAHAQLVEVCEPFSNENLNLTPPFDAVNPTAEQLARHIAEELAGRLNGSIGPAARVFGVTVTEAPGCSATYRFEV